MIRAIPLRRGDVVLVPMTFVSTPGATVRPAVVIPSDRLEGAQHSVIIAIITSTNSRAKTQPSHIFLDLSTQDGKKTGLLHDSTVKCEHLATIDSRDVQRVIGSLAPGLETYLNIALMAALGLRRGLISPSPPGQRKLIAKQ